MFCTSTPLAYLVSVDPKEVHLQERIERERERERKRKKATWKKYTGRGKKGVARPFSG